MRNILHIIESLEFGGAEKVVLQLANGLCEDFNISICLTKREGELRRDVSERIRVYPLLSGEGNNFSVIKSIRDIIDNEKIDVVHIHNWGVFVESVIASRLSGVKNILHTVHGPYITYNKGFVPLLKKTIRHKIEKILSYYVTKFISVSDAIQDYMVKQIGINRNKIVTIHNGIKGLTRIAEKTDKSAFINLVSVGRVAKVKNHKLLLKALSELDSQLPVHLTVVGDGPELESVKEYCKSLNLVDKVSFTGFKTNINEILSEMDICVVSSDYEGISIAILEAMSLGMPVIASAVGGNPEIVNDNETGILFSKGNADELATAIQKLSKNKKLAENMGENGLKRFLNHFHEKYVLEQYSDLYNDK